MTNKEVYESVLSRIKNPRHKHNCMILGETIYCTDLKDYYNAIKRTKCNCDCHTSKDIMHFMPCCEGGYVYSRIYIKNH